MKLFGIQWKNIDPCSDYYTYAYMNRQDVQKAIHANVTKLNHDWEPCRYIYAMFDVLADS